MRSVRDTRRERITRVAQPYPSSTSYGGNSRVYVGNLSWEVSWPELKDHMKAAGHVVRADVMQESSGRSKGCGIVEYASPREASAAIRSLHDTELRGRKIFVREDREMSTAGITTTTINHPYYTQPAASYPPARSVYPVAAAPAPFVPRPTGPSGVVVENLPADLDWGRLKDHFKPAGFVVRADIVTAGVGVVDYNTPQEARNAVQQLDNTMIGDRVITVRLRGTTDSQTQQQQQRGEGEQEDDDRRRSRYVRTSNTNSEPVQFQGERKLHVGQLAWSVTWQRLKDHFKQIGNVVRADVATEPSGRSKGFGFVEFATAEEARRALEQLDGTELDGRTIYVKEDLRERQS